MNTETQFQQEPNPYRDIEYFTECRKFQVRIPDSRSRTNWPTFDTLQEAMDARDGFGASLKA